MDVQKDVDHKAIKVPTLRMKRKFDEDVFGNEFDIRP
jgi:hypothetical protein